MEVKYSFKALSDIEYWKKFGTKSEGTYVQPLTGKTLCFTGEPIQPYTN